jgi:hypothetical protein
MRARPRAGVVVVTLAFFAVALAIASVAWWPVYQTPRFVIAAVVALAAGFGVALAGALLRWPSFVVLIVGVVLFVATGVPVTMPSRTIAGVVPTADALIDLIAAVALGWKQLLTVALPVGDYQALLVPFYALVLAAAATGLSLALRLRAGEIGMITPAVVLVAAIAFGADDAPASPPLGLALLAVGLLWLMWRRWQRRQDDIRALARSLGSEGATGAPIRIAGAGRAVVAGSLLLAVAAAASLTTAAALPPDGPREVLRTVVEQPFDPREYASPLAGFRRYLRDDRADAVQLIVEGLPPGARLRIATLDSYDGVVYAVGSDRVDSASGTFVRIPSGVDQSAVPGGDAELEVTIEGYRGVWMPTVGQFESVRFAGDRASSLTDAFVYNDTSGTAAVVDGLEQGDGYRLLTRVPDQPTTAQLVTATPGSAPVPRIDELPDGVTAALDGWVAGQQNPGERLAAMVAGLRTDGYISHGLSETEPPSRSGHGSDRISELVTAPRMIGDAEQYAVAAALMARQLGFPARVVVGFAPEPTGSTVAVLGSDITAWIEVDTAEYGWVTVDPVPEDRPIPDEEPEDPTQIARPQTIVPPPAEADDPAEDQSAPENSRDDREAQDPFLAAVMLALRGIGIGLVVIAALLSPFLLVIAAKLRRRRLRRSARDVVQRIRGGWDEFTDTALDHGYEPPPAATRSEWAATVGSLPSRVLAAVADRAVFAPETADPRDADRVWGAVDELRAAMGAGRTRRQRLRARISLRSLGGYSIRKLFSRGERS